MKNRELNYLIEKYANIISKYDYTSGRKTFRLYKQSSNLKKQISKLESNSLRYFLDNILEHKSLSVQLCAAVLAIENQYRTEEAMNIILNIREMNVLEVNSYAPITALPALTEYFFDNKYPYIYNIFHKTSGLMKKSISKRFVKHKKIMKIISLQDEKTINMFIEFLNNRKHDGCFMYYGALLAYKYNYHTEEATKNMIMISSNERNWGRMSRYCSSLLSEHKIV